MPFTLFNKIQLFESKYHSLFTQKDTSSFSHFFQAKQEDVHFMTILPNVYAKLLSIFNKSLSKHLSGIRHYHKRAGIDFRHNVLNQNDLLLRHYTKQNIFRIPEYIPTPLMIWIIIRIYSLSTGNSLFLILNI